MHLIFEVFVMKKGQEVSRLSVAFSLNLDIMLDL